MKKFVALLIFIFAFTAVSGNLYAMGRKPKEFPITIKIDFGPAGKPVHEEKLYIEEGTTPIIAAGQVFPVQFGKTCCSFREILGIDGVNIDPAKNRWWYCKLNGSKKVSPRKKKLKEGDYLEWQYVEEKQ